jgi:hypothetical protein
MLTARGMRPQDPSNQIASSVRRPAFVYKGMEHTSRSTGRRGLLATPLVAAALALVLSACGSSAPTGSSASSGSPALSGSSPSSDASATAFCGTWQEFRTTLAEITPILDDVPTSGPSTTPASVLLPTMQAINRVFTRLDQEAPPAVSTDMNALTSYWSQVVADFQPGETVAQVEAYIKAHPPSNAATITASTQQLSDYLTSTCGITMSS